MSTAFQAQRQLADARAKLHLLIESLSGFADSLVQLEADLARSRKRNMLSARRVETLNKPGRYADGGGLWLQVSKWNTKAWIFQFSSPTAPRVGKPDGREIGRVRHLGLGPYGKHDVTLARARELAARAREQVRAGIDPIDARRAEREQRPPAGSKPCARSRRWPPPDKQTTP
jgi:hypothetical protein